MRRLLSELRPGRDELVVVLDAILTTREVMAGLEKDELSLVSEAYFRGASWSDIALRLDRSKQSVHQRYQSRIHSRQTRDLLAADAQAALRNAVELCRSDSGEEGTAEARAFLRDLRVTAAGRRQVDRAVRLPPVRSDARA